MKKIYTKLVFAGLLASAFTWTGCFILFGGNGGGNPLKPKLQTASIDLTGKLKDSSEVYMVQVNTNKYTEKGIYMNDRSRSVEQEDRRYVSPDSPELNNIDRKPDYVLEAYNLDPRKKMEPKEGNISVSRSAMFEDYTPIDWTNKRHTAAIKPGTTVSFWVKLPDPNKPENIIDINEDFTCKVIGEHCRVFYLNNITRKDYGTYFTEPTSSDFKTLADKFDSLYEAETNILGKTVNTHVNKTEDGEENFVSISEDDKINILVYDIKGDATKDQTGGILGYFYSADLYKQEYFGLNQQSNETEVFYVDLHFFKESPEAIYSTLAHEFCHMLNYITKVINVKGGTWETWFSEMLAMNTEDLLSEYFNPKAEVRTVYKERIPGFLYGYQNGMLWKNGEGTYEDYSYTYALGAYLIRNFGGVKLFHEIATNEETGIKSINAALKKCNANSRFESIDFEKAILNFFQVFLYTQPSGIYDLSLNRSGSSNINGFDYNYNAIDLNSETFRWASEEYFENLPADRKKYWKDIRENDKLGQHTGTGINMFGANYQLNNIGPRGFCLQKMQGTKSENGRIENGAEFSKFTFAKEKPTFLNPSYIRSFVYVKNAKDGNDYCEELQFENVE